jgi:hypothetical protein
MASCAGICSQLQIDSFSGPPPLGKLSFSTLPVGGHSLFWSSIMTDPPPKKPLTTLGVTPFARCGPDMHLAMLKGLRG